MFTNGTAGRVRANSSARETKSRSQVEVVVRKPTTTSDICNLNSRITPTLVN